MRMMAKIIVMIAVKIGAGITTKNSMTRKMMMVMRTIKRRNHSVVKRYQYLQSFTPAVVISVEVVARSGLAYRSILVQ